MHAYFSEPQFDLLPLVFLDIHLPSLLQWAKILGQGKIIHRFPVIIINLLIHSYVSPLVHVSVDHLFISLPHTLACMNYI